jgi:hypothetical protein
MSNKRVVFCLKRGNLLAKFFTKFFSKQTQSRSLSWEVIIKGGNFCTFNFKLFKATCKENINKKFPLKLSLAQHKVFLSLGN